MYWQPHTAVGELLDEYRIEAVLGRGGMGVVYKATNTLLDRTVALKVVSPELAEDKAFVRRFHREARALARLHHPNIVSVHTLRQAEMGPYIAMEYVDGSTLADWLLERVVPWQETLPLVKQLLEALDYAHERGVIHRDLKPRNVMLTEQGVVKIMDFGLARVLRAGGGETTLSLARAGTLFYMSPEQARGLKTIDHRSDLFSLGMTLYEMLSGRLPFNRDDSEFTILKMIVEKPFPEPHRFNAFLPLPLERIIMRALEKEPARRYSSARAMLDDLEVFEAEEHHHSRADTLVELPDLDDASATPPRSKRSPSKVPTSSGSGRTKWPMLVYLALAVAILGGSVGGFFVLPGLLSSDVDSPAMEEQAAPLAEEAASDDKAKASGAGDANPQRTEPDTPTSETQEPLTTLPTPPETGNEANLQGESEEAELATPTGRLRVTSSPSSAKVFIDGERVDTTPLTLTDMPVGSYRIEVQQDGFKLYSGTAHVEENGYTTLSPTLEPLMGRLRISAKPWGRLFINGEQRSAEFIMAETYDLPVGTYQVRVENANHGSWQRNVTITTEGTLALQVDFTEEFDVRVGAIDENDEAFALGMAEVIVDGDLKGTAPRKVTVSAGLHRFEIRAAGYETVVKEINVDEDGQLIQFQLRKEDS